MGYRGKNKAEQEIKMSPSQYKKMRGDLSLYQAPKLPKDWAPRPCFLWVRLTLLPVLTGVGYHPQGGGWRRKHEDAVAGSLDRWC